MSTYTSEPGTRLAGRYRLIDQVHADAGWTYWKATDETLARPVTVLTFAAGFPRTAETVAAARAASRLSDPRFSQVFDVEDAGELAYVVLEWVAGESLLDMLSDGPLEAGRAVMLVSEAAQALAAAHAAGLMHLRLDPSCLHWTPGGGVKITGLGVSAALAGTAPPAGGEAGDPAAADTRGLARLLYAALTGYWPCAGGPADADGLLQPAPEADRAPFTPRQVSAAVPAVVDDITCRALFQRPSRHGPALSTPAMFAEALASAAPPPVPPPARPAGPETARYRPDLPAGPVRAATPYRSARRRRATAPALVGAVIAVILAAAGIVAWSLGRGAHAAQAGQRQQLRRVRQRRRERGRRRRALRDRRDQRQVLAHRLLPQLPEAGEPQAGHRADPRHGQAGQAEPGDGAVRPDLLRRRPDRDRQRRQARPLRAEQLHHGGELRARGRNHHLRRDRRHDRPLRADLDHRPAADGGHGQQVPGADLQRRGAWLGGEPVGLMPHARRRRAAALGHRTAPQARGRRRGSVR